jgi:hypothetical protein
MQSGPCIGNQPRAACFRKTRYRGLQKVDFAGYLVGAAYNLVRLARMLAMPTLA